MMYRPFHLCFKRMEFAAFWFCERRQACLFHLRLAAFAWHFLFLGGLVFVETALYAAYVFCMLVYTPYVLYVSSF